MLPAAVDKGHSGYEHMAHIAPHATGKWKHVARPNFCEE
jgi:hypothetical protein